MTAVSSTTPPAPTSPSAGGRRHQTRHALHEMRATLWVVGGFLLAAAIAIVSAYAVRGSSGPAGDIQATTVDFRIKMPTTLATGTHTIGLTNDGKVGHEVVLFKTALPANKLPLNADGDVNEDSPALANLGDSGDALAPGGTKSFKTDALTPGHYVAVCNLPGHYKLGMRLNVTVR